MKYFIDRTIITAADVMSIGICESRGSISTKWNKTHRYETFGHGKVYIFQDNSNQCIGLFYNEKIIAEIKAGNYYSIPQSELKLKYVPKKIKNADYPDIASYLDAVVSFLNDRSAKAEMKLNMKLHDIKTNAAIDYMGVQDQCEEIASELNYPPLKADSWAQRNNPEIKTMNEWYKLRKRKNMDFKIDGNHYIKTEVAERKGVAKFTVVGVPIDKMPEVLKYLMEVSK